jgi:peptidyl-prolyl cis-trans isomerase C
MPPHPFGQIEETVLMNASRIALAALAMAVLAACTQSPGMPKEEIIATVNGKPISRNTFEQYAVGVTSKPSAELTQEQRDTLLDNLVRAAVVADNAVTTGIADRPEVAGTLDIQRLELLERASAREYLKDRTPSEEELRAEYDLRIATMDKTQYRLSHIQVASAEDGQKLIAQLDAGANFATLAREHSLDANTKQEGGDLMWAAPSGMPPSFATATRELKKGEVSKTPLRSEVGWHVVKLVDSRDAQAPPFEEVREQLLQAVREKQFTAFTDGLVEKATITKTP